MITNDFMYLNQFDHDYKKIILNNGSQIDEGITLLVNAINSIDVLCTMDSCEGALSEKEKNEHCYMTYVDFYVLHHQYHVANKLFSELVHKFGSKIECEIFYEADFNVLEDDYTEDNGLINLRYHIEILELENLYDAGKTYMEIVSEVIKFKNRFKSLNSDNLWLHY